MEIGGVLQWLQAIVIVVAGVTAVVSIRATTNVLTTEIKRMSSVITDLKEVIVKLDVRVMALEIRRAEERGAKKALADQAAHR